MSGKKKREVQIVAVVALGLLGGSVVGVVTGGLGFVPPLALSAFALGMAFARLVFDKAITKAETEG